MSSGSRKVKRVPSYAKFFQGFIRSSSVVVSPPPFLGGFHPVRNITGEEYSCAMFSRSTMEHTVHKTCAEELTSRLILQSYEH